MPQIWMTYDEFGSLLACSIGEARSHAMSLGLERKKSRDGHTRVKLNPLLTGLFCARVKEADLVLDTAVAQLRSIHAQMASFAGSKRRVAG